MAFVSQVLHYGFKKRAQSCCEALGFSGEIFRRIWCSFSSDLFRRGKDDRPWEVCGHQRFCSRSGGLPCFRDSRAVSP